RPNADENPANNMKIGMFHRYVSWSFMDYNALKRLAEFINEINKEVLSVGSGRGWIESLLQKIVNPKIIATDNNTWDYSDNTFTEIEQIDAIDAIKKYNTEILMMIWPHH